MTTYRRPGSNTRGDYILQAALKASRVRQQLRKSGSEPVCPVDAAQELGADVRYTAELPSMEGTYLRKQMPKPLILVSPLRPIGRLRFTVAHELGHHVFGHEGHVLKSSDDESQRIKAFTPEELLADAFAAHFLMPKVGVMQAFNVRNFSFDTCSAEEVYRVAWYFGVGYDALLRHACTSLKIIPPGHAKELRIAPKKIRAELFGHGIAEDVVPVDFLWNGQRAVDVHAGDIILLPEAVTLPVDCKQARIVSSEHERTVVQATAPGITRLNHAGNGWAVHMRVSRKQFSGLARYRFFEEEEDDISDNHH